MLFWIQECLFKNALGNGVEFPSYCSNFVPIHLPTIERRVVSYFKWIFGCTGAI